MFWSTDEQDALLLLFSCSIVSNFLRPRELQHARLPCPSLSPKVCSNSHPLSQWCHPTISSSVIPFSSHLQSPSIRVFSNESVLRIRWPKYWSFSFKHQSFQWMFRLDFLEDWLVWFPCCPRNSQESSLASQFENINSSALRFLYGPTFTLLHDYWKNHSFEYMDLCQHSDVSAF